LEKQVFADAPDIVPAIYLVQKSNNSNNRIGLYKSVATKKIYDLLNFTDFRINEILQQKIENKKSYIFSLSTNQFKELLINKLGASQKVNSKYKVVYGITTGDNKRFVQQEKGNESNWKKCASSADNIKKYFIKWKGDFLNITNELAGLNKINYEQPKILIQYIRKLSMPIRLVCAFDSEGEFYPLNNYSFIISEQGNSLKLLLGIMNSKLMNWYFSNCFVDYNIKPKYIEQLPLPSILHSSIIENMIDEIWQLKSINISSDTTVLESEIDRIVYQLYGLTDEEIRIVEGYN